MSEVGKAVRRALLPVGVFATAAAIHYLWLGLFAEGDSVQGGWAAVAAAFGPAWFHRYVATQSHWLGYSYSLSFAFAAVALRRHLEKRQRVARDLAIGGVAYTGLLVVLGCYLLGCCGSPMAAVYLNLLGAAFLPFAKPLVAGLTTLSVVGACWWMDRTACAGACGSGCSHRTQG